MIHNYNLDLIWVGNLGSGTLNYKAYSRNFKIVKENKHEIIGSSDPAFRGDLTKYNPEELLLASVSSCHMLWFLHLASENKVVVLDYKDNPSGKMVVNSDGGGKFEEITLNLTITFKEKVSTDLLHSINKKANKLCFIANSLNFKIKHIENYIF